MKYLIAIALLIVAVIHLLPLAGVLGADKLGALYGVPLEDPNLVLLMRHRAILFGMLGVFLLVATFRRALQPAAFAAGMISVVSFLVLAWGTGDLNAQTNRVVVADLVALTSLGVGILAWLYLRYAGKPN